MIKTATARRFVPTTLYLRCICAVFDVSKLTALNYIRLYRLSASSIYSKYIKSYETIICIFNMIYFEIYLKLHSIYFLFRVIALGELHKI